MSTPRLPNASAPLDAGWAGPIADCFERSALKTPSALAISYRDTTVSYAALRAATNKLAHALRAAGMGKGSVVGLYGHRSPSVVWAIMGILKAGAAYTMMDPKYPADRIICCVDIAGITGWIQVRTAFALTVVRGIHLTSLCVTVKRSRLPASRRRSCRRT
jgi:non-ribosomal peptide synthetase component F